MTNAISLKKPSKVESIDMTPTWEETSRMLALILERGTPEGRATARLELERMGRLADFANVVLGAHRRPDAPAIPEAEEIRRKVAAYDSFEPWERRGAAIYGESESRLIGEYHGKLEIAEIERLIAAHNALLDEV